MTALLATASSLIIGASDFFGGLASRKAAALRVTTWVQATSLLTSLALVWFFVAPVVTARDLAAGAVAGIAGSLGLAMLYAALAMGQMSRVSPVSAVVGAVVPAAVEWIRGEQPTPPVLVGGVLALVAVTMVTREHRPDPAPNSAMSMWLAILAGTGFGVFFLAFGETSEAAGIWPVVAAKATSVPVVAALALTITRGLRLGNGSAGLAVAAGISEMAALVLLLLAVQRGSVTVVAVIGALYPVATVGLAGLILKEKLEAVQWAGVALAVVAVVLIAAG